MPDTRRLFVALAVPPDVRAALAALRDDLDGARWTRPEQLHLTLRFLGDVPAEQVPEFEAGLRAVEAPPLDLRLAGLTVFPNRRRPRVLVVRIEREEALGRLQHAIEQTVQALGIEPEPRPFRPHVTLARLRQPDARAVHAYLQRHAGLAATFTADHFALYASTLRPDGAVHQRLATFPLVA